MSYSEVKDCIERFPVIAAIHESKWKEVLESPVEVIFFLKENIMTVKRHIDEAHSHGKRLLVHIDLADGIGKDDAGIDYLAALEVDGIISTRGQLIRYAKEKGLVTVQRFFALDSQGIGSIQNMLESTTPDFIEVMPGVVDKVIERFARGNIPVIAGGLIETKQEVTTALSCGAFAVSTGTSELWYL